MKIFRIKIDDEKELTIKVKELSNTIDIMLITKTLEQMAVIPISNNHIELKLLK